MPTGSLAAICSAISGTIWKLSASPPPCIARGPGFFTEGKAREAMLRMSCLGAVVLAAARWVRPAHFFAEASAASKSMCRLLLFSVVAVMVGGALPATTVSCHAVSSAASTRGAISGAVPTRPPYGAPSRSTCRSARVPQRTGITSGGGGPGRSSDDMVLQPSSTPNRKAENGPIVPTAACSGFSTVKSAPEPRGPSTSVRNASQKGISASRSISRPRTR
mmetsp:Transcript_25608/g.77764  ORF Transcript_25608/g.77764 Transcript_25608/m.77764 type:complete len:220 (-) Transcript_25608:588-1247(-)